ncbi:MAG: hypothetical protein ACREV3_08925 [Gammaproteobacteria bacterium]
MDQGPELETNRPGLPGYWRMLWMLFMQPVTLGRWLKACEIKQPDDSAWRLWREPGAYQSVRRAYIGRMFSFLFFVAPVVVIATAFLLYTGGIPVDSWIVVGGVVCGVALGVALGVGAGVALGVSAGVGVALGVALGVSMGVAAGVVLSVSVGVSSGVGAGVFGGVAFIVTFLRIPLYPLETLLELILYLVETLSPRSTLRYSPLLFHDMSYLPYPFLAPHIILGAAKDPALARRAIDACAIAPGQRRAGLVALARLQALELQALAKERRFVQIVDLQGHWLPGVEGTTPYCLPSARRRAISTRRLPLRCLTIASAISRKLNSGWRR